MAVDYDAHKFAFAVLNHRYSLERSVAEFKVWEALESVRVTLSARVAVVDVGLSAERTD